MTTLLILRPSRRVLRNAAAVLLLLATMWGYSFVHSQAAAALAVAPEVQSWMVGNASAILRVSLNADESVTASSLRSHGTQRDWLENRGEMFRIEGLHESRPFALSGRSPWKVLNAERTSIGGSRTLHLHLQSRTVPLVVALRWHCQPGRGPLEFDYRLSTPNGEAITITRADSVALPLHLSTDAAALHWVRKGRPDKRGLAKHRLELVDNQTETFRSSADIVPSDLSEEIVPWLVVENDAGGWYSGWAFSGHGRFDVRRSGRTVSVAGGLDPEFFRHELRRGEWFSIPGCLVGLYTGTLDDGVADLHQFLRTHWIPASTDDRFPLVQFNTWTALDSNVNESNVLRQMSSAAALGPEVFVLDGGWYKTVGDWKPDPARFPRGLQPLADRAHGLGMKFGLWMAWAQIGPDLLRQHPDWVAYTDLKPSDVEFTRFASATMCLGHRPVREWLKQEIDRVIRVNDLDYMLFDQSLIEMCRRSDHTHQTGDGNYAATRGLYEVLDWVRSRHPDLIIENCCGGGNILDYGIMRRTHLACLSDIYGPGDNRRATYGGTYPFPATVCESYMEDKNGEPRGLFRSAMMGLWNISADTTGWSPDKRLACQEEIARYKREVRPLLREGRVRHLLGQAQMQREWDGLAFENPRTGQGMLFGFRSEVFSGSDFASEKAVPVDGSGAGGPLHLHPNLNYKVVSANGQRSSLHPGAELISGGLSLGFASGETSQIVSWQRELVSADGPESERFVATGSLGDQPRIVASLK